MAKLSCPKNGVRVRMYRLGHGDCFLFAFPRKGGGRPVYVLIDCGYKPNSPGYLEAGRTIEDVVTHIDGATGGHLDLLVVTHEHQDHVNGFFEDGIRYFDRFRIDEVWMAWTEDGADPLANQLRKEHNDTLLNLVEARRRLAAAAGESDPAVQGLDATFALELGVSESLPVAAVLAAAKDPERSDNKQAMRLVKAKAREHRGVRYLRPGEPPRTIPGTAGLRAFVLGPPRNAARLRQEDPTGREAFPKHGSGHGLSFGEAVAAGAEGAPAPFSSRHCLTLKAVVDPEQPFEMDGAPLPFFVDHYGVGEERGDAKDGSEVSDHAGWRRIDDEWLYAAESLAIKLKEGINNTSLVLAIELPTTRKVLLFIGDAQRGNWVSWTEHAWDDGGRTVDARDLLARTVLYKVGHHGSHNATLAGQPDDGYPNLSWMGQGEAAREFAAMIPAVKEWAATKRWTHPLPSIREALLEKAGGRVFQTDIDRPTRPSGVAEETWAAFSARTKCNKLYFDYDVLDE